MTFCHERVTPCAAEEGLTGILAGSRQDTVQCYSPLENLTEQEVKVQRSLRGQLVLLATPLLIYSW